MLQKIISYVPCEQSQKKCHWRHKLLYCDYVNVLGRLPSYSLKPSCFLLWTKWIRLFKKQELGVWQGRQVGLCWWCIARGSFTFGETQYPQFYHPSPLWELGRALSGASHWPLVGCGSTKQVDSGADGGLKKPEPDFSLRWFHQELDRLEQGTEKQQMGLDHLWCTRHDADTSPSILTFISTRPQRKVLSPLSQKRKQAQRCEVPFLRSHRD